MTFLPKGKKSYLRRVERKYKVWIFAIVFAPIESLAVPPVASILRACLAKQGVAVYKDSLSAKTVAR